MGVYINGMDRPPDGRYTLCITHDSDGGVHWVIQNQDTLEFLKHGAVTEIPEPHGDLIDRNELKHVIGSFPLVWEYGQGVTDCWDALTAAQTVIPAEEGE